MTIHCERSTLITVTITLMSRSLTCLQLHVLATANTVITFSYADMFRTGTFMYEVTVNQHSFFDAVVSVKSFIILILSLIHALNHYVIHELTNRDIHDL